MKINAQLIHRVSLILGLTFFFISLYLSFFEGSKHFYTWFALGSWLVLDWVDYKLTHYSTLGYFLRRRNWQTFLVFFSVSGIFCFVIDILYGVHITGIWEWSAYSWPDFLRMILIMNVSFLFSVYELFRVIHYLVSKVVKDVNLLSVRVSQVSRRSIYIVYTGLAILGFLLPLFHFVEEGLSGYIMFLPFLGMFTLTEAFTYFAGGNPFTEKIIKLNSAFLISFLLTWAILAPTTEFVNLFSGEWRYLKIPFPEITAFAQIPVAVFIGWMPLMLGALSSLNLVKHWHFRQSDSDQ